MRIGFDVSPLHRPHPGGLVRVVHECVTALERRGRIEVVRLVPPAGVNLRRWRFSELARRARELDGLHSFVSAFALFGPGPRVQTIHELPWRHGVGENADLAHRMWNWFGPLRARAVVTATEFSARDLRRRFLPGRAKVRVIPWGVGAPFTPGAAERKNELFCPGATRPKKGLAAVIEGAGKLPLKPRVLVTGVATTELERCAKRAAELGVILTHREHLDEAELVGHYRSARAVPLLSHSEGFCLPVLEALACGTRVIVPRASAQAEVAGSAGIEVDPADPASVAAAIESVREGGIERAAQFSWERTAAAIEDLWLELAH